jgi:RHS repeat-associated protein
MKRPVQLQKRTSGCSLVCPAGHAAFVAGLVLIGSVCSSAFAQPSLPVSPMPVVNYEYDAEGNLTKVIAAPGVAGFNFATQSAYDSLQRNTSITNAKSGVIQLGSDRLGRTTSVTDPRNLVTQTPRNGLGSVTQLNSPDTGLASHTFDAEANLKTRTDSRGVLATYTYDALSRLASIAYTQAAQPSQTLQWTYDQVGAGFSHGVGRLTSTTHPGGAAQYSYDPQGRLLTSTQRVNAASGANTVDISLAVGYSYDSAGRITQITYPSGRVLAIAHSQGQPSGITLSRLAGATAVPVLSQIQWRPFGGPSSWRQELTAGPQTITRSYDMAGRAVRYPLGPFVRDLSYDAAGRISGYSHFDRASGTATAPATALSQTFSYDELGRITGVTSAASTWAIDYDANGNRTSVTLNGAASIYTTAATSNRLQSISNPARNFGYDNAGNTTSDSRGTTSSYDLTGRLASLTSGAVTTTFTYNAFGQRVRKYASSGAASTVLFAYDQDGHLLGEYDSTGAALREYVWLGSTPVAMFTPGATAQVDPTLYFIDADHLDTPRVVIDKDNAVRWMWLAEPFGNSAPQTDPQGLGAFTLPLRFPGQYADPETGLNYNWHRDYDASMGRYVQSDPIGLAGGINTYSYVDGNPLSYIDFDGLQVTRAGRPLENQILEGGGGVGGPTVSGPSPNFAVSSRGTVFPIPSGARGPVPVKNPSGNVTGSAFTGGNGGANGQVCTVRFMDATPPRGASPGYPNGYVKYENATGQGVDPYTGRTLPNSQSHFPR